MSLGEIGRRIAPAVEKSPEGARVKLSKYLSGHDRSMSVGYHEALVGALIDGMVDGNGGEVVSDADRELSRALALDRMRAEMDEELRELAWEIRCAETKLALADTRRDQVLADREEVWPRSRRPSSARRSPNMADNEERPGQGNVQQTTERDGSTGNTHASGRDEADASRRGAGPSPLGAFDAVADVDVKLTTGERLTLVMLARRRPRVHPGSRGSAASSASGAAATSARPASASRRVGRRSRARPA